MTFHKKDRIFLCTWVKILGFSKKMLDGLFLRPWSNKDLTNVLAWDSHALWNLKHVQGMVFTVLHAPALMNWYYTIIYFCDEYLGIWVGEKDYRVYYCLISFIMWEKNKGNNTTISEDWLIQLYNYLFLWWAEDDRV